MQFHYSLGNFEMDDIIFNTIGAAIGTLSYLLYNYIDEAKEWAKQFLGVG